MCVIASFIAICSIRREKLLLVELVFFLLVSQKSQKMKDSREGKSEQKMKDSREGISEQVGAVYKIRHDVRKKND